MNNNSSPAKTDTHFTCNNIEKPLQAGSARSARMVAAPNSFWPNGSTLTIAFTPEPSAPIREKIIAIASEWLPHINLHFNFVEGPAADIRIEVDANLRGGQSEIGNAARDVPPAEPTMSLGLGEHSSEQEFRVLVLHEFGHALGALHEHQHPDADIPWDRSALLANMMLAEGMTEEIANLIIDIQFTTLSKPNEVISNAYDRDSIMHYDVANSFSIGDFEVQNKGELSPRDIQLMNTIYPR